MILSPKDAAQEFTEQDPEMLEKAVDELIENEVNDLLLEDEVDRKMSFYTKEGFVEGGEMTRKEREDWLRHYEI